MFSTKNFPADTFKVHKLSLKCTGPVKVLEYNPQNQNVGLDFSDFAEFRNISNKFHTSLLPPFTPNDDLHLSERKLNSPGLVEEPR